MKQRVVPLINKNSTGTKRIYSRSPRVEEKKKEKAETSRRPIVKDRKDCGRNGWTTKDGNGCIVKKSLDTC